ncbi:hypothetical protein GCM10007890_18780 [Methylobacterium tardum]|uniref:Uncharacterized protein n=1 Tax=Methylobacterium tardum TaxID=374432 RepID=A0AA37WQ73_9HYPH|nr:hypothetical protein GCM10007890_18780 [Methylobacterium tardum]
MKVRLQVVDKANAYDLLGWVPAGLLPDFRFNMRSFEVRQELAYTGPSASDDGGTAPNSKQKCDTNQKLITSYNPGNLLRTCGTASLPQIRFCANGTITARCGLGGITALARRIRDKVIKYVCPLPEISRFTHARPSFLKSLLLWR